MTENRKQMAETFNDRRRVSSRFIVHKVIMAVVVLWVVFVGVKSFYEGQQPVNLFSVLALLGVAAMCAMISMNPLVEYEQETQKLYVKDMYGPQEVVFLKDIVKIHYRGRDWSNLHYQIGYKNSENKIRSFNLYQMLFKDDVDEIIEVVKRLNPEVEIDPLIKHWLIK